MLQGEKLLGLVDSLKDSSLTEIVTAAGYTTKRIDGTTRVFFTEFYETLLKAKGINPSGSFSPRQEASKALSENEKRFILNIKFDDLDLCPERLEEIDYKWPNFTPNEPINTLVEAIRTSNTEITEKTIQTQLKAFFFKPQYSTIKN